MIKLYSMLAWSVINLWSLSLRVRRFGTKNYTAVGRPVIFVFYHGEQFALYRGHLRRRGIAIMTSLSRDGELQDGILRRFGYETVRGSSSRGGARALIGFIRSLRGGHSVAFAADGPRGPARRIKPGPVYLSAKTRAFMVPMRVYYDRARILSRTWDRYVAPFPFSRVNIVYGAPIAPPESSSEEAVENKRRELEAALENLALPPSPGGGDRL